MNFFKHEANILSNFSQTWIMTFSISKYCFIEIPIFDVSFNKSGQKISP